MTVLTVERGYDVMTKQVFSIFLLGVCLTLFSALNSESRAADDSTAEKTQIKKNFRPGPQSVIFDTDIGNDVDDALSLAVIHALIRRGELNLLAVTSSNGSPVVVPYVRMLNACYGRPSIPVGLADQPAQTSDGTYMLPVLAQREKEISTDSSAKNGHKTESSESAGPQTGASDQAASAVPVLRRTLADAPDRSVVMIMTGYATNLPRLLDSPPDAVSPLSGRELVLKKVDHLVAVAGAFTDEYKTLCENNLRFDLPAGRRLAEEWPTPIIWSGYEIGKRTVLGPHFFDAAFIGMENSPMDASYRAYGVPYLALWDLVPPLLTARPDRYFTLSQPGRVTVREDGTSFFTPEADGRDRIVLLPTPEEALRAVEAFSWLISEPPSAP